MTAQGFITMMELLRVYSKASWANQRINFVSAHASISTRCSCHGALIYCQTVSTYFSVVSEQYIFGRRDWKEELKKLHRVLLSSPGRCAQIDIHVIHVVKCNLSMLLGQLVVAFLRQFNPCTTLYVSSWLHTLNRNNLIILSEGFALFTLRVHVH